MSGPPCLPLCNGLKKDDLGGPPRAENSVLPGKMSNWKLATRRQSLDPWT